MSVPPRLSPCPIRVALARASTQCGYHRRYRTWPGSPVTARGARDPSPVEEIPVTDSQVWFVTGASSGFGRAIAEAAAEAGDTVVAAVRRPEALDDLVKRYPDLVEPVALDVTDTAADKAAIDATVARHGRIDVLVNNAGRTQVGAVEETTD